MDLGFAFDFRARRVDGDLGRAVEQVWFARGTVPYRSEQIAPTGSTVVLLILGDAITETSATGVAVTSDVGLVIGPHTAPVTNAPHGETHAVGIVTTPVGGEAVVGRPPAGLRGRVAALADVDAHLRELRAVLHDLADGGADPEQLLDRAVAHLARSIDPDAAGPERVARAARAVDLLVGDPRAPIAEVAATVGVSHAHLDREFARVVGLRPRELARLLLLRRLVDDLDPCADVRWADVAAGAGWSDQAHFTRDFTRHTGLSPARYLRLQRAFAEAGNAGAGFSPDLERPR